MLIVFLLAYIIYLWFKIMDLNGDYYGKTSSLKMEIKKLKSQSNKLQYEIYRLENPQIFEQEI